MDAIRDRIWIIYSGEEIVDMEGVHLVTYHFKVMMRGYVEGDLEDCGGCFPDTQCPVKWKRSKTMPPSNNPFELGNAPKSKDLIQAKA
ncbi:phospholipase D alpha 4 [Senna tora]|uniref:Phospholipase D alpha 4 n=1 Tax=Senna tora TaxID=362788 RepID=A0A834SXN6_9FABA|nr:phospholipase D alpha 4 [Senna tora]